MTSPSTATGTNDQLLQSETVDNDLTSPKVYFQFFSKYPAN